MTLDLDTDRIRAALAEARDARHPPKAVVQVAAIALDLADGKKSAVFATGLCDGAEAATARLKPLAIEIRTECARRKCELQVGGVVVHRAVERMRRVPALEDHGPRGPGELLSLALERSAPVHVTTVFLHLPNGEVRLCWSDVVRDSASVRAMQTWVDEASEFCLVGERLTAEFRVFPLSEPLAPTPVLPMAAVANDLQRARDILRDASREAANGFPGGSAGGAFDLHMPLFCQALEDEIDHMLIAPTRAAGKDATVNIAGPAYIAMLTALRAERKKRGRELDLRTVASNWRTGLRVFREAYEEARAVGMGEKGSFTGDMLTSFSCLALLPLVVEEHQLANVLQGCIDDELEDVSPESILDATGVWACLGGAVGAGVQALFERERHSPRLH